MKYSLNFKMGLVLSFVTLLGLSSCDNVLPVPSIKNGTGAGTISTKAIATPENVRATHGRKGIITISWTPIFNAQYYFIYKANSPHDTYVQIDEAKADATSIDIKVPSGTSGYFKVAAVDAYNNISDMSLAVYGTSLATPIITAIEEEEDTATVYWYMQNVSSESYLSTVRYDIHCYNADGTPKETKTMASTTDTVCKFEDLNSATRYYYEVEAYIVSAQDSVEKSLKLDSETAVNLVPHAPEFSVSQGDYTDKIEIKIKLPEIGKILAQSGKNATNTSSYESRPLYFVIEKREKIEGVTDGNYNVIVSYLNYKGTTSQLVTESTPKATYEDGSIWNDYTQGNEIIYYDSISTENRGIKYEYRVLSFVDYYYKGDVYNINEKIPVTHDTKKARVMDGWAAATARFFVSRGDSSFEYNEVPEGSTEMPEQKYKTADSVKFELNWNSLGKESNYVYLFYEQRRKLKGDNGDVTDTIGNYSFVSYRGSCYFDSIEDINSFTRLFEYKDPDNDPDNDNANSRGYYKYSLCIVPKTVKQSYPDANVNVSAVYNSSFMVVNDLSNIAITNGTGQAISEIISVSNGYKNKTEIKFTYQDNATYKIKRTTLLAPNVVDTSVESVITELVKNSSSELNKFTVNNDVATYVDTNLNSGKYYSYSLFAANDEFEDNESMGVTVETLGTPVVEFDKATADYKTITVTWNKVLQATKYKVTHNSKTWTVNTSDVELEGLPGKIVDTNGEYEVSCLNGAYTFVIKSKAISDFAADARTISATKAGRGLSVKVDAVSDLNDSTSITLNNVHVLGPAQINLTASEATSNNMIKVQWQMIDGVTAYALRRECPNIDDPGNPRVDVFTISSKGSSNFEISSNGERIDATRMSIVTEGSYIVLSDKHAEATDVTKGYQISQEQIAWGHEYIYSVTPIKVNEDNDPFDDGFDVIYQNITNTTVNGTAKKGFASGYGLNINASKSDYPDMIHVTWTAPNSKSTLKPQVWVRAVGDTEWKSLGSYASGTNSVDVTLEKGICANYDRCSKVEFAVNYEQNKTVNFKESYTKYLAENGYLNSRGELTGNEPNNIGYEFTLQMFEPDLPVSGAETFTEKVNWTLWNSTNDERKNKPGDGITGDCYEIYILNKNCSNKWYKIATVSKEGRVTSTASSISWGGVAVSGDLNYLTVTPDNMEGTNNVHDGLLKVQRDYKHYYKIVAKRKNSLGEEIETKLGAFDETEGVDDKAKSPVYTYRKITDKEFVLGVSLIIADASYKTGVYEAVKGETFPSEALRCSGATGKFGLYRRGGTKSGYWGTGGDYKHIFYAMPCNETESLVSGWSINVPGVGARRSAREKEFYYFAPGTVTVKHETGLASYQGTMTFTAGGNDGHNGWTAVSDGVKLEWKLSITSTSHGSYTYSANNETDCKKIFPFQLACDNGDGYSSYNESLPLFNKNSLWWEVRN